MLLCIICMYCMRFDIDSFDVSVSRDSGVLWGPEQKCGIVPKSLALHESWIQSTKCKWRGPLELHSFHLL